MSHTVISLIVFFVVYASIIFNIFPRSIIAFAGAVVLILTGVLAPHDMITYVNWEALGLILGMFILVQTLKDVGFFDFMSTIVLKKTKGVPLLIFFSFALLAGFLSAFMDSITVLLFMSTLSIEVARKLKVSPVPFVFSQITAANIGGSSTLMGDPPNVILGTGLNITLVQFVRFVAPLSIFILLLNTAYFIFIYRRSFLGAKEIDREYLRKLNPYEKVKDLPLMISTLISFFITVLLLFFHRQINLSVGMVGIIGASLALVLSGKKMEHIWGIIEWEVLVFFATLFLVIGALEKTGVIASLSSFIINITSKNVFALKGVLLWFSSLISGVIDNVPFAASMVPILKNISSSLSSVSLLSLGLLSAFAVDVGGNFTPIGASANVVGITILDKSGFEVTWIDYLKSIVPITILNILVANIYFMFIK
jgi:Na+/H+ antiporter NhaD/arsenite permease-like protein